MEEENEVIGYREQFIKGMEREGPARHSDAGHRGEEADTRRALPAPRAARDRRQAAGAVRRLADP